MITYRHSAQGITPDQLKGFFVGWSNKPSPEIHLRLLRGFERGDWARSPMHWEAGIKECCTSQLIRESRGDRRHYLLRLRHILDAAVEIVAFVKGMTRDGFHRDRKLNLAVVHLLEVIGEAAYGT